MLALKMSVPFGEVRSAAPAPRVSLRSGRVRVQAGSRVAAVKSSVKPQGGALGVALVRAGGWRAAAGRLSWCSSLTVSGTLTAMTRTAAAAIRMRDRLRQPDLPKISVTGSADAGIGAVPVVDGGTGFAGGAGRGGDGAC